MNYKEGAIAVLAGVVGILVLHIVLFFLLLFAIQALPEIYGTIGVIIVLVYLMVLFTSLFSVPSAITGLVYEIRCPRRPYKESYALGALGSFLTAMSFVLFLHFYSITGFQGTTVIQLIILVVSFSVVGGLVSSAAAFLKRFLRK